MRSPRDPSADDRAPARVKGDGLSLAVWDAGPRDAPTIVLVHGYPDDHTVWDGVASQLADRFHVVRYDVRGAGRSDRPLRLEEFRVEHLARDLLAVVEAAAGGKPAHVVGHDWGAVQSWELVTDPTARPALASFTAISGPCMDHVAHWVRRQGRSLAQARKSAYIGLFHLPRLPELFWGSGLGGRLLARMERLAAPPRPGDAVRGLGLYRANVRRAMRAPRERRTEVPVQLVVPTGDRYVGGDMARTATGWATSLRVREVDGGHWVLRREPAAIAAMIAAHVDAVEAR